ncbi:cuticle protein 16.4 [Danaus plexippus plexippus]|uniref:Cuticle protein 16.4 n=1 Tax=Danaus plexippus plexippus TaxID=278856 RepID=A0A212EMC5_DANPL|nr:cuticle protein 16.4 [Danaus plexippus plexippus]
MLKLFIVACAIVAVHAGGLIAPASYYNSYYNGYSSYPAQPAISSQQANIIRTPFNLGQLFIVACAIVAVHAGGLIAPASYYNSYYNGYSSYPAQPAISSQQANIIRSPFNLGQISTYSKAIDTPFSSVRKADIRVSNPGLAIAPAYRTIASPILAPAPLVAPKVATGLLGVAYSAAPAVSHMTYTNALGLNYAW